MIHGERRHVGGRWILPGPSGGVIAQAAGLAPPSSPLRPTGPADGFVPTSRRAGAER